MTEKLIVDKYQTVEALSLPAAPTHVHTSAKKIVPRKTRTAQQCTPPTCTVPYSREVRGAGQLSFTCCPTVVLDSFLVYGDSSDRIFKHHHKVATITPDERLLGDGQE